VLQAKSDMPQVVTVPGLHYLMIDGHGDPNTPAFAKATATLYPVAYKLEFASKKTLDRDHVVEVPPQHQSRGVQTSGHGAGGTFARQFG
jgi:hypothetical protein